MDVVQNIVEISRRVFGIWFFCGVVFFKFYDFLRFFYITFIFIKFVLKKNKIFQNLKKIEFFIKIFIFYIKKLKKKKKK